MSLFTLPTASAVRTESRLRPEQVSVALADTAALETEITSRILRRAAIVETRILETITETDWAAMPAAQAARRGLLATDATWFYTLSTLYESAGQLNDQYEEKADRYKKLGDEAMDVLLADIRSADNLSAGGNNAGTLVTSGYVVTAGVPAVNTDYYDA